MGRRYEPPEGWTMQSFGYALEHGQPAAAAVAIERSFGARRFSHNWTVQSISDSIAAYRETGQESPPPSLASLRKEWNRAKDEVAADSGTGEAWWPGISKEVFNDGIAGAVDGYWNWQKSRAGARAGRPVGFPKRHRKNRRRDSFTICQPSRSQKGIRIADNRHLRIPVVGVVRTCESMRNLARLVERGMARIMAVTASRKGGRLHASLRVEVLRPQRHHRPSRPDSRVGVDIGERCLAVVADSDGTIIETVENPAPLKKSLAKLRRLNRKLSRQKKGSNGWNNTRKELNRLHRRIACTRDDALHKLTTRLAKTHGAIVIEDLNVAGMRKGGGQAPERRSLRRVPPQAGLQNRLVRVGAHTRRQVVPLLQDMLSVRARPNHRTQKAMGLRRLRHTPRPRPQRRSKPRQMGAENNTNRASRVRAHPRREKRGRRRRQRRRGNRDRTCQAGTRTAAWSAPGRNSARSGGMTRTKPRQPSTVRCPPVMPTAPPTLSAVWRPWCSSTAAPCHWPRCESRSLRRWTWWSTSPVAPGASAASPRWR